MDRRFYEGLEGLSTVAAPGQSLSDWQRAWVRNVLRAIPELKSVSPYGDTCRNCGGLRPHGFTRADRFVCIDCWSATPADVARTREMVAELVELEALRPIAATVRRTDANTAIGCWSAER